MTATQINLNASIDLTAAAGDGNKPAKVQILAYAGGPMRVPGYPAPVAVDLDGLTLPESLPLLLDHANRIEAVAGSGVPSVRDGRELHVSGTLARESKAGESVLSLHRAGVRLSASVGVSPSRVEQVRPGEKVSINGRVIEAGPEGLAVVRAGALKEISLVAIAADDQTDVQIAASRGQNGEPKMTNTNQPNESTDVLQAERKRAADILAAYEGVTGGDAKAREAIEAGHTVEAARTDALEMLRASRPKAPRVVSVAESPTADVLACAALSHWGFANAVKTYPADVQARGRSLGVASDLDFARACLAAEGRPVEGGASQMIAAAFSTSSLSGALEQAAENIILDVSRELPASFDGFAAKHDLDNFREHSIIRPTFLHAADQVGKGGELKHGELTEGNFTALTLKTFGQLVGITRRDLINDSGGRVFGQAVAALTRNCLRSISDEMYRVVLANGGNFFHADNANLLTGADSALSVTSLAAAISAMRAQRGADGRNLDIVPRVLLVPPELEHTGRQLLASESVARFVSETVDQQPEGNALHDQVDLAVEPRLSNEARFDGTSATAWYLLAGPMDVPANVGYLQGQRAPLVEFFGLDSRPDVLGVSWRVYQDFGAALGDPAAAIKSNGV